MYSKLGKGIAWFFAVICGLTTMTVIASQEALQDRTNKTKVNFQAKPANCVALRQGRTCFATVSLSWHTANRGHFCIYEKASNKVMQCWNNSQGNTLQFEFESNEKIAYQLRATEQNIIIAETSVDVSWVHKATVRKRRWRLF
ncbi:hypothetical protein tinsulaeT_11620 [Thalassotalea insulae]|uniref:DUF3019 domain-containing protein n=2 Tax=Thalassotalea insulae TaxID=2056778 RepID=A0ABQ6GT40_9GAMM|nr:hypothetical protein tinsulaeT_11620 [Thalassotalea insulae]